jgi:N-acetylmuramoyl-L-alanine amidase
MSKILHKVVRTSVVLAFGAVCWTMPIDSTCLYLNSHVVEAATNQTVVVTGTSINLRSGPGTNHAAQGQVSKGDRLLVLGKQGDWYQVKKSNGQTAWIASWLVKVESNPITITPTTSTPAPSTIKETVVVSGTSVNLRGGPGTSYPLQGQANQGDKLPILAKQGDWLKVKKSDGQDAWIASWLAKIESTQVTTSVPSIPTQTPTTSEVAVVTATHVNLRGGAGTNFPIQGQVNQGDKLPVLGKQGDWLKVKKSDGKEVWIAGSLARVETVAAAATQPTVPTPTTPPGEIPSRGDNIDRDLISWLPTPPTDNDDNKHEGNKVDKGQVEYSGPKLTDIEVDQAGDKTIIRIAADSKISYNTFSLSNPNRLVVNLEDFHLGDLPENQKINSSVVKELRVGQFSSEPMTARMVLDLSAQVNYRTTTSNQGKVLEIELNEVKYAESVAGKVIFIDAGHGGSDPGAPGYSRNTWEEDANLDMALKLAAILKQQGAVVEMSRTADQTVDLSERPRMANRINADIFVSIHSNANNDSSIRGTSTYFYAPSSRQDLHAQRTDRQRLAQDIQNEMVQYANLPDKNIREANFAVLRESNMPSVLVETAYISNPEEEKLLADSNFRQQVAEAIARGINAYFSGK